MSLIRGQQREGRRIVLFGKKGEGKSTWMALAPKPYIIDCGEHGLADINVDKSETCTSIADVFQNMDFFRDNRKAEGWWTLGFDTGNWLEKLMVQSVCGPYNAKSLNEGPLQFGVGNNRMVALWDEFLRKLDEIRSDDKRVTIIFTCHVTIRDVTPPNSPAYQEYVPDLSPKYGKALTEWASEVFFINSRTAVTEEKLNTGIAKKRNIPVGGQERFIRTTPIAGIECKHRLTNWIPDYPAEIDFVAGQIDPSQNSTWNDFFPGYYQGFAKPATAPVLSVASEGAAAS